MAVAGQRESASAFILRGQHALEDGDFTAAESLFRQAVTRNQTVSSILVPSGRLYFRLVATEKLVTAVPSGV